MWVTDFLWALYCCEAANQKKILGYIILDSLQVLTYWPKQVQQLRSIYINRCIANVKWTCQTAVKRYFWLGTNVTVKPCKQNLQTDKALSNGILIILNLIQANNENVLEDVFFNEGRTRESLAWFSNLKNGGSQFTDIKKIVFLNHENKNVRSSF